MRILPAVIIVITAFVLAAGCTTPAPVISPTPVPTALPTVTADMVPQPTSVVPPYYNVSVQVQKNTISTNPYISIIFNGGQGLGFVTVMQATVIRSDGSIEQKSVKNPQMLTELDLNGTIRDDRVIVTVTYVDGKTYTVKDLLVPFQNINPTRPVNSG